MLSVGLNVTETLCEVSVVVEVPLTVYEIKVVLPTVKLPSTLAVPSVAILAWFP